MCVNTLGFTHQISNRVRVTCLFSLKYYCFNRQACQLLEYADFQSSKGDLLDTIRKSNTNCTAFNLIQLAFFFSKSNL